MALLVYLALLAFLLVVGVLAASVLPARGARIGLAATAFLALTVDLTWLLAPASGWSPQMADAIAVGALLLLVGGALVMAEQYRLMAGLPRWGWPSGRDLAVLLVVIVLLGAVVWLIPVPLDTDAQGFGYLALMLRDGGDYTTLAPWHPEIDYLYSPAFIGLAAHLSARFDPGLHAIQLALGAVISVLFIWSAYDLGCELDRPRTGRAFLVAAIIGTGLLTAFMDSHYTALLALLFSLGFVTFVLRYLQRARWTDAALAAVCLAGVPLSQPDTTIALMIGYVPWLLTVLLAQPRPRPRQWFVLAVVIPLAALLVVLPWLLSIRDLLGSEIESPFVVDADHWRTLVFMHGGVIVLLAAFGFGIGLRRRTPAEMLAITWLVGIIEFSTLGLLETLVPDLVGPLLKYDYPFSLAWHGPIIPYIILGGFALLGLSEWAGMARVTRLTHRAAYPAAALALIIIGLGTAYFDPVLRASRDVLSFYGAFASEADVAAMRWLRDNVPPDARVLNHPGPQEGDWVPVISERDTIFYRPQPFFQGADASAAEQDLFRAVWRDPADSDHATLLDAHGVRYVIVPQVFGRPDSFADMVRWERPIPEAASYDAAEMAAAAYLRLVFEQDGAQVYEVIPPAERVSP